MTPPPDQQRESDPMAEPDGVPDALTVDRGPSRLMRLTASALVLIAPLPLGGIGLVVTFGGALIVVAGTITSQRQWIHGGGLAMLVGIVIAAIQGHPAGSLLLATMLAIVGWDVSRYGIVVGEQLGRTAATTRIEVAHTGWSLLVGALALVALSALDTIAIAPSWIAMWILFLGTLVLVTEIFVDGYREVTTSAGPADAGDSSGSDTNDSMATTSDD